MTTAFALDALTSATLKHVREHWWDDEFTAFLRETLKPRPGNRILDVGCGEGQAEIAIGRLHLSQIRLFGVDQILSRVVVARHATSSHNQRVGLAAGDACCLPFLDGAFDSTYCVAVLQHVPALSDAVREFARVTRTNGRIVIVEPDNATRYWYSSVPSGTEVQSARASFFGAMADGTQERATTAVGPRVATLMTEHGIEPLAIRLFPVEQTLQGPPPATIWSERQRRIQRQMDLAGTEAARAAGTAYLSTLERYRAEAQAAGQGFVEIQNTLLFATVGQKNDE